ncbi:MAG: hypothetical protein ACFCUI_11885 [Bernardetiaceae bacterium]
MSRSVNITTKEGKTTSQVASPTAQQLQQITAHQRATLHVSSKDGKTELAGGISASVGQGGANKADDVSKIYARLKALGLVSGNSAAEITAGIGKFQQQVDTAWWASAVGKGSGKPMLGGAKMTPNAVHPNDVTFLMLRDRAEHTIQFKDYRNQTQKVVVKNFVKSSFADNPLGIAYAGTQLFPIPASYYQSIGVDPGLSEVLAFVSQNEGKFDAINSWDRAFFSFGFVQFAGGNRSLHTLLALIKYRNLFLFNDCFQRFGIDVEYTFQNNKFSNQRVVTISPGENGKLRHGDEAEQHLGRDLILTAAFIRAGYDIEIAKLQVLLAAYEYANPALERRLTISAAGGASIQGATGSFIRSPAGVTALVDMAVNQGVGGASRLFTSAISAVAQRDGLRTEAQIQAIDERKVLTEMMQANAKDSRITSRVGKALQQLSTSK